MAQINICEKALYIQELLRVISSYLPKNGRLPHCAGRHSDAFVLVTNGSCFYQFDEGHNFTAKAGDIIYLAFKDQYQMTVLEEKYSFIYCDFMFFSNEPRQSRLITMPSFDPTEKLFKKLLRLYEERSETALAEAVSLLYCIYSDVLSIESRSDLSDRSKSKVAEAKSYIDAHYKDPDLSVGLLADRVRVTDVYLRRLFKAEYGIQPSKYIISVRLKYAKELMRYSFLSMEECALQSGFTSLNYFCRAFKKETGLTPSEYKKLY